MHNLRCEIYSSLTFFAAGSSFSDLKIGFGCVLAYAGAIQYGFSAASFANLRIASRGS